MEIADVVDGNTLEAYVKQLHSAHRRDTALDVAFLSAARVLPIAVRAYLTEGWAQDRHFSPVSFFGAIAICGASRVRSTSKLREAFVDSSESANIASLASSANIAALFAASAAAYAKVDEVGGAANAAASAHAAALSNGDVDLASSNRSDLWAIVRANLAGANSLWPSGVPWPIQDIWDEAKIAMADHHVDWTIWINWYDRLLQNRDWKPEAMGVVLEQITRKDWEKGPEHINPMFDEVLALYLKEDAATSDTGGQDRSTNHVQTIRAQVFTLQEFLQAEYLSLAGHNARTPEQDDIFELLKALKALVDDMIAQLDRSDDKAALVVVRETLPAVFEKAGELAVIEPEPMVSPTVATMSATIRSLTEAGADPELATKFAISEAAGKKLWPRIKGLFGRQ